MGRCAIGGSLYISTLPTFLSFGTLYVTDWRLRLPLDRCTDDGAMLTACPKCHHLFEQPCGGGGGVGAEPSSTTSADPTSATMGTRDTSESTVLKENGRQCCPTVMTLNVPSCAVTSWAGDSVILQKGTATKMQSPEPSPSVPLSFVLPPSRTVVMSSNSEEWNFSVPIQCTSSVLTQSLPPQSELDFLRLSSTLKSLSISGWYYEGLSWQQSVALLMPTSPGTFLVRDSSDPRYLFSLSVQTERGPTSVRLYYSNGQFRLDAQPKLAPKLPRFNCVVKLVEYYIEITKDSLEHRKKKIKTKDQVWIDSTGQMYSHILLTKPLCQKEKFPTLQHLSRLAINKLSKNGHVPITSLPAPMNRYLQEYPYTC
ncbi:cytokine-inducible SH2-containing protein-like isoform X2 [Lycorma delicatula]|uniref:cytokine-inducible SH2-containing protein-like isoform X2 n=1 Tax=Lycorma delicatula TaxID=130591 RepID=UPI003F51A1F4